MPDYLPRLLPNDPQNLLSVEARKRVQRSYIEADKLAWKAEIEIEQRHLDSFGEKAKVIRNKANLERARVTLVILWQEFSRIGLTDAKFREIMRGEIEGASNSFELTGAQTRLLETEFFFQEEQPTKSKPRDSNEPSKNRETVGTQIERLRQECRLTVEELAAEVGVETRSVYRHLSDKASPRNRQIAAYEKVFSKRLKRPVRLETSC